MVGLHGREGEERELPWNGMGRGERENEGKDGNNDGPKMIDRPAMAARVEVPLRVHRSHDMGLGMGEAFTKLARSLGLKPFVASH